MVRDYLLKNMLEKNGARLGRSSLVVLPIRLPFEDLSQESKIRDLDGSYLLFYLRERAVICEGRQSLRLSLL